MSCQVLLENVRVKESAFSKLGLPILVKSGAVGKLELSIPYGNFYTKPVSAGGARKRWQRGLRGGLCGDGARRMGTHT